MLPILAASVLTADEVMLENCPHILDVETMVEILRAQGCYVMIDGSQIRVRAHTMDTCLLYTSRCVYETGAMLPIFTRKPQKVPGYAVTILRPWKI